MTTQPVLSLTAITSGPFVLASVSPGYFLGVGRGRRHADALRFATEAEAIAAGKAAGWGQQQPMLLATVERMYPSATWR